jgi:hypothetical protein
MSLGRPGNRNWSGGHSIVSPLPGQSGRSKAPVAETYPRPADWHDRRIEALVPGCSIIAAPALTVPTRYAKPRNPRPARYFASRSISTVESAQFMARFVMTILRSPVMISAKASMTTPCANR